MTAPAKRLTMTLGLYAAALMDGKGTCVMLTSMSVRLMVFVSMMEHVLMTLALSAVNA